jgi:2-aminoethylphosphonate-pyruvate transaminase
MKTKQKEQILFTPGPLTTSRTTKLAMMRDLGSRDSEFIEIVKQIRCRLVQLGQTDPDQYTAVLIQGSGTFALEAVVSSTVPPDGKLLIIINGAYGKRLAQIASTLRIDFITLDYPENTIPDLNEIEYTLKDDTNITNVSVVHCETTTGIMNPVLEIGELVARSGAKYFVDAMSSFAAVPLDLSECGIDYLVSSANKCIEGVPGFSFVLCKLSSLMETDGYARTLSLDLLQQYRGFEKNGQFRFTPPTHALLAFRQALDELREEGGVQGRAKRYYKNYETLVEGMRRLGFKEYLRPENQGYIITSFLYPEDPNFSFEQFYDSLRQKGFVIYPGKVSDADCFRIGSIGRIFEDDISDLLDAIKQTIDRMNVKL